MTAPEDTPLDAPLEPESSTADVSQDTGEEGATSNYQQAGEEGAATDYQARMEGFDTTDTSVELSSLPTESGDAGEGSVELKP